MGTMTVEPTVGLTVETAPAMADSFFTKNTSLYLYPEILVPNENNMKARLTEKPEQREKRVAQLATSILQIGQEYPVLVVEVPDVDDEGSEIVRYEYVDGGARVDAVSLLNEVNPKNKTKVWCSILDANSDLFRQAVTANIQRTQTSVLDMAHIVKEAAERHGWDGRGSGKLVAKYLGIETSRVSEYRKILAAEDSIKSKIEEENLSLDAALKLLAVPHDKREEVISRAKVIAQEEAKNGDGDGNRDSGISGDADPFTRLGGNGHLGSDSGDSMPDPETTETVPDSEGTEAVGEAVGGKKKAKSKDKPAPIKAKHIARASREVASSQSPRGKADFVSFFEQITSASYPDAAVAFCDYLVDQWVKGSGTDKELLKRFDAAVGLVKRAPAKKAAVTKKVKTAATAKKTKVKAKAKK